MPMPLAKLLSHIEGLRITLWDMGNPAPPEAIKLFKTLLGDAQAQRKAGPLVHEIPFQGPDARSDVLVLFLKQVRIALEAH